MTISFSTVSIMCSISLRKTLLGLLAIPIAAADSTGPIVKLESSHVTYHGTVKNAVEHFQNIKFAMDTSGGRRFAAPEPYTPPAGSVVDATAPGAACPQATPAIPPFFDETPNISEDCLSLRISRPAGTTENDNIPVVVWVHGGAVIKGSAYDSHFDPDKLITLSSSINKPVIYVSINYRITIFGFARLPTLKDQKSLNVGMRDQRVGFQWVKDNIAAFGGDPTRITAYGLSAGGTFTSLHPIAYGGEQGVPFTQIWAMSGPPGTAVNITSDATELHTLAVAEKLQCGDLAGQEQLQCLRDIPMERLTDVAMEYSMANHPPLGGFTFIPSIDGDFIPDRPSVLYKSGKFAKDIPTVLGWTQDDGAMNAGPASAFQAEEDIKTPIKTFAHALSEEDYKQLFALYPESDFQEEAENYAARKSDTDPVAPVHFFRASRILRDLLFTCSSLEFGYAMSVQSKASNTGFSGVRLYDLNQSMLTPMFKSIGMPYIQACHGSDTHYIFNGLFPEGEISQSDQALSRSMASSFITFAHTGNPTYADDEHFNSWPESFPDPKGLSGLPRSTPSQIDVLVIGGPLGTGFTRVAEGAYNSTTANWGDQEQQPLDNDMRFQAMETAQDQERARLIQGEKLLERCAFIGSLSEKLGV